ncbi:MAG TPA: DUF4157 domain-containing protein, partial [Kofleriaceae bacterium]
AGVATTLISPEHARSIGPGRPLEPATRRTMELFFEADFSSVRVHEGPAPSALGALAFTIGDQLHFAKGRYAPTSPAGAELLGHELAHVVQQRSGRVANPYGRAIAIVQDPALEREAHRLGREVAALITPAAARRSASVQRSTKLVNVSFRPYVPRYPSESSLVARLRGIDSLLRLRNGELTDLILAELEDLTEQITDNAWLEATALILTIRDRWHIDQFPPPLIPADTPHLVEGGVVLEHSNVIYLPRHLASPLVLAPGSNMIELGAGPMDSACALWSQCEYTAFTEFRSREQLVHDYGEPFQQNLLTIQSLSQSRHNTCVYGIDATQVGPYRNLPLTRILRFTNPNIGHQDIRVHIESMINQAVDDWPESDLVYTCMGMRFTLSLDRLNTYGTLKSWTGNYITTLVASTTNSISTCRNIKLIYLFLLNAPAKLIPGVGVVQIIVSTSYLTRWPLEAMARRMGYGWHVDDGYELGFENIKTQEDVHVSHKAPKKCLITLTPPWHLGFLTVFSVVDCCADLTVYTTQNPSLVSSVKEL